MRVLVTGAAGFIGSHVAQYLLARGDDVVGLDNVNDYYSPQLKRDRLARLTPLSGFELVELDVADRPGLAALFARERFDGVVHLAAQAGVRYSLTNQHAYVDSNRPRSVSPRNMVCTCSASAVFFGPIAAR